MTTLTAIETTFLPTGESAMQIRMTGPDREAIWLNVHQLADSLNALNSKTILGLAATYDAILLEFDPLEATFESMRLVVDGQVSLARYRQGNAAAPRHFRVPVLYGGDAGPDLPDVAQFLELSEDEVVQQHSAPEYLIRCFGAPAGSPMTDGPGFTRPIPRLGSPRPKLAAGSVAVAGQQGLIYSLAAPGGWQLLGRTPLQLVSLQSESLTPYVPGDYLSYYPITGSEWHKYDGKVLEAEHG